MSKSWGHQILSFTPEAITDYERKGWGCTVSGCEAPPRYQCSYAYVTGRRGRVTRARRDYCVEHAQKFAKKHGLELPALKAADGGGE